MRTLKIEADLDKQECKIISHGATKIEYMGVLTELMRKLLDRGILEKEDVRKICNTALMSEEELQNKVDVFENINKELHKELLRIFKDVMKEKGD